MRSLPALARETSETELSAVNRVCARKHKVVPCSRKINIIQSGG